MIARILTACCLAFAATVGLCETVPAGSASLDVPEPEKLCADTVDGQSVDAMIAQGGSIDVVYQATLSQIVEIDRWIAEATEAKKSGVKVAEIQAVIDQAVVVRGLNVELQLALECRMEE